MKKRSNYNPLGTQKFFKNVPADVKFNPLKKWYGTISTSNGSFVVTYESIVRSEAEEVFKREAKATGGTLDKYIGVVK